jgi:hypothetical protein
MKKCAENWVTSVIFRKLTNARKSPNLVTLVEISNIRSSYLKTVCIQFKKAIILKFRLDCVVFE